MKNRLAPVKNIAALSAAYEELDTRDAGVPGMGLVHGYTGAGKTTAIAWLTSRTRGVFVRAAATWTPSAMLGKIMIELGGEPLGRSAAMVDFITAGLAEAQRPLFVDEADYLLHNLKMLETLRDIHDISGRPVVLIGMEGIERRLVTRPQLARRISRWVEFKHADLEDASILANHVCEVKVAEDLLAHLHNQARGSMGLMTVGLSRIESLGKANGLTIVTEADWGDRRLFISAPSGKGGR